MDPKSNTAAGNPIHSQAQAQAQTRIPPPHGYALSGKIMVSAIVVLFTIVLLILFVHLYVRWHVYRRSHRLNRRRRRRRNPLVFTDDDDDDDSTGNRPAPPAQRGLDPKVLDSLPVSLFSAKDVEAAEDEDDGAADVAAASDCAVCISEFEEGEKVRVLPRCGHRFHINCIDMWFGSHSSCPLCRSAVEAPPPQEVDAELGFGDPQQCAAAAAPSTESPSSPANREVRIEIRSGEGEAAGLGFGQICGMKRFWSGDLRSGRGEMDHERGEARRRDPPAAAE